MDHARACQLLEAKDHIERTLTERGVVLDAEARTSLGWALKWLTEEDGYSVETASKKILEVYRRSFADAA